MKLIKISYSSFWSSLEFSMYLYGFNPIKKQCLCVYKDSIKYGITCNEVLKINDIPRTSEWYLEFLPQIAEKYGVQVKDLTTLEREMKPAKVPIVVFPLDLTVSFLFYVKSRFVLCQAEFTDGNREGLMENIHYIFNITHCRSLITNGDHYHYQYLKTLGRESIATFYNMDRDIQVWEWFQLRFKDLTIYQSRYFCPKNGFDLIIEEIYQRPSDPFPVVARIKECVSLPQPQDFVITMNAASFMCTHLDVSWWFGKIKYVLILSTEQSTKAAIVLNDDYKVEKLSLSSDSKNVTINKFQYHCLKHLLELDSLAKMEPIKNFDKQEYHSIKVYNYLMCENFIQSNEVQLCDILDFDQ